MLHICLFNTVSYSLIIHFEIVFDQLVFKLLYPLWLIRVHWAHGSHHLPSYKLKKIKYWIFDLFSKYIKSCTSVAYLRSVSFSELYTLIRVRDPRSYYNICRKNKDHNLQSIIAPENWKMRFLGKKNQKSGKWGGHWTIRLQRTRVSSLRYRTFEAKNQTSSQPFLSFINHKKEPSCNRYMLS